MTTETVAGRAPGPETVELIAETQMATARIAAEIGGWLQHGDLVTLTGTLGVGKTAFARALIRSLAAAEVTVPSPTFTLVQLYELPGTAFATAPSIEERQPTMMLWHFDLYRIGSPDELVELGWDEARANGITVVEWPDRLPVTRDAAADPDRLDVTIAFPAPGAPDDQRWFRLAGYGRMADKLRDAPHRDGLHRATER